MLLGPNEREFHSKSMRSSLFHVEHRERPDDVAVMRQASFWIPRRLHISYDNRSPDGNYAPGPSPASPWLLCLYLFSTKRLKESNKVRNHISSRTTVPTESDNSGEPRDAKSTSAADRLLPNDFASTTSSTTPVNALFRHTCETLLLLYGIILKYGSFRLASTTVTFEDPPFLQSCFRSLRDASIQPPGPHRRT